MSGGVRTGGALSAACVEHGGGSVCRVDEVVPDAQVVRCVLVVCGHVR